MSDGQRVGGRWTRTAELPAPRGLRRWRAVDDQGLPVEILGLAATRDARQAASGFLAAHRALAGLAADPGVARIHAVLDHPEPLVVRDPLHDRSLDELVGTLPPGTVADLGARLVPVLLAHGAELGGAVLAADLGVDRDGRIVLAPQGPIASRVARGVLGAVAPEVQAGRPADGQATLYALGALLYRLATGRLPPVGAAPPPPSSWNHRVPPELDRAILRLLSPRPEERPGALPDLVAASGPVEDPRPLLPSAAARSATPAAVPGRPAASGPPLLLDAAALAALDPRGKSVAAGLAGVPLAAVDALVREGLPLVIGRGATSPRDEANRRFGDAVRVGAPAPPGWFGALAAFGLFGAGGAAAVAAALLAGPVAAAPAVAVALAGAGLAGWRIVARGRAGAAARAVDAAWTLQEGLRTDRSRWPAVAAVDQRIARLRVDLAHADLPDTAERDVRDALKEIDARLDAALGVLHTAERALGSVDRTQLAVRLEALSRSGEDPQALDQAARTSADLADVAARRDRQLAVVADLGAALDELAASLAEPAHHAADAELSRAARTARLLRERRSES